METWLRYLIAFVVFCHGFIYVRIGSLLPGPIKGWQGRSWLLGSAVTDEWLNGLVITLHVIAGIVTIACAVAIAFGPAFPGWWRSLAIGAAVCGIAAFAVFWDGQAQLLFEEGAVGAIISVVLLGSAMAFPLAFR